MGAGAWAHWPPRQGHRPHSWACDAAGLTGPTDHSPASPGVKGPAGTKQLGSHSGKEPAAWDPPEALAGGGGHLPSLWPF